MELKTSKEMKIDTLKVRKRDCLRDDVELAESISQAAAAGEFYVVKVRNQFEQYMTISDRMIKELKDLGYKVDLWDKKVGWDDLHRYYKGALKVSWYK